MAVSLHSCHMVRDFLPSDPHYCSSPLTVLPVSALVTLQPIFNETARVTLLKHNSDLFMFLFKFLKMLPSHLFWVEAQVPILKCKVLHDCFPLTSLNSFLVTLLLPQCFLASLLFLKVLGHTRTLWPFHLPYSLCWECFSSGWGNVTLLFFHNFPQLIPS